MVWILPSAAARLSSQTVYMGFRTSSATCRGLLFEVGRERLQEIKVHDAAEFRTNQLFQGRAITGRCDVKVA